MPTDLRRLLPRLDTLWAEKRPDLAKALRPGATDAALKAFERAFGRPLPAKLATLYRWHDGAKDQHFAVEGFFGWPRLAEVIKAKRVLDDLESSGDFTGNGWGPGVWWNLRWVPFLQFNLEDHVCIDEPGALGFGRGAIFERRNVDGKRVVLAPSLAAWLEAHLEITAMGPTGGSDDDWTAHFQSTAAKKIRKRTSPGFPASVVAKQAL